MDLTTIDPEKDMTAAHAIATAWREPVRGIVAAFVAHDFSLLAGVPSVEPPTQRVADQVRQYLADYPETLVELPDEAWSTSVAQWMGTHWEALVDLWTESGLSDLVLALRVFEADAGFRFEIDGVYVP
jgi:hypothetical protein